MNIYILPMSSDFPGGKVKVGGRKVRIQLCAVNYGSLSHFQVTFAEAVQLRHGTHAHLLPHTLKASRPDHDRSITGPHRWREIWCDLFANRFLLEFCVECDLNVYYLPLHLSNILLCLFTELHDIFLWYELYLPTTLSVSKHLSSSDSGDRAPVTHILCKSSSAAVADVLFSPAQQLATSDHGKRSAGSIRRCLFKQQLWVQQAGWKQTTGRLLREL